MSLDKREISQLQFAKQSYAAPGKRTNIGTFTYDPDLSNIDTAVWHDATNKRTHVSNRGSVSARDWLVSDAQILTGMEDRGSRFKKAVNTTKQAHDKFGFDVETSGHSLGATLSSFTTEKLGDQPWYRGGTGFNQGNSSIGRDAVWSKQRRQCRGKNAPAYCYKQTNIKEQGDYVSERNIACDMMTFGLGGKLCRKGDAFGKTKVLKRKRSRLGRVVRAVVPQLRYLDNARAHSINTFDSKQ